MLAFGSANKRLKPKIFIVGFNKCGTTTLHQYFKSNNLRSVHWDGGRMAVAMQANCIASRPIMSGYDRAFTVFSDMVFLNRKILIEGNAQFRNMDADYPQSYFIYNTRNIDDWIASRLTHDGGRFFESSKAAFHTNDKDKTIKIWKDTRYNFEADIRQYFHSSPRFLELDINAPAPQKIVNGFLKRDFDETCWEWRNKSKPLLAPAL
jgi:hypothetical protein